MAGQSWSTSTKKQTDCIDQRLKEWWCSGEVIEQPIDLFNDKIDYTPEAYDDPKAH